jgi:hypothetical protein
MLAVYVGDKVQSVEKVRKGQKLAEAKSELMERPGVTKVVWAESLLGRAAVADATRQWLAELGELSPAQKVAIVKSATEVLGGAHDEETYWAVLGSAIKQFNETGEVEIYYADRLNGQYTGFSGRIVACSGGWGAFKDRTAQEVEEAEQLDLF